MPKIAEYPGMVLSKPNKGLVPKVSRAYLTGEMSVSPLIMRDGTC
jgi:hypothetical protein